MSRSHLEPRWESSGVPTFHYGDKPTMSASNGVLTEYTYDVLGRRLTETSPDRGTIRYEYDLADNLVSMIDGRGIVTSMSYDQLERMVTRTYLNVSENVTYTYDTCPLGTGKLCALDDESGHTGYRYDAFGNPVTMIHTELGVTYTTAYRYDEGDHLIAMTLPSGRQVTYSRDGVRRLSGIDAIVNGATTSLVSAIRYRADNKMTACTYGNGLRDTRAYDLQGRLRSQALGTVDSRSYRYDANSNLLNRTTTPQVSDYGYDPLDRVIGDTVDTTPIGFDYDLNGNRLARQSTGIDTAYQYVLGSNRLVSIDSLLSTVTEPPLASRIMTYNNVGRLSEIIQNGTIVAVYTHNALGQRTRKVTAAGTTVYHYDLTGQLISETQADGTPIRDYLWDGMQPAVQIDNTNGQEAVSYLHTDHLMTPRFATDRQGNVVWRWEGQAFGNTQASGSVTVNLRFPGQYYDEETGLHYNWFRYYEPVIGRYVRSDPIGLDGGLNTFGYVGANSLRYIDKEGESWVTAVVVVVVAVVVVTKISDIVDLIEPAKDIMDTMDSAPESIDPNSSPIDIIKHNVDEANNSRKRMRESKDSFLELTDEAGDLMTPSNRLAHDFGDAIKNCP